MTNADRNTVDLNSAGGQEQTLDDGMLSASELLSSARKAKGLSQQEVADQLYLSVAFIRYIDDGEFQKLSKPAYIKGYLRLYAKLVSIDGDVVVLAYDRGQNDSPQVQKIRQITKEAIGSRAFTGPVVQTGIIGFALLVVAVALVWWLAAANVTHSVPEMQSDKSASAPGQPGQMARSALSSLSGKVQTNEPLAHTLLAGVAIAPLRAVSGSGAGHGRVPTGHGQDTHNTPVEIERKRDGDKEYITVLAGGKDQMKFSFSNNCWMEITDGHGQKIYGDLNHAGDLVTVDGIGPYKVLLGKASVVTMTWHGQPVDVTHYITKDDAAKIATASL